MDNLPVDTKRENTPLYYIIGVAILWLLTYFGFRFFQYYVDPDATSYLNIIKNYLAGNYKDAINAYWSPLSCWLTALLVKATGTPLFAAAIIVNTIAATGALITGQALFFKFRRLKTERVLFTFSFAVFLFYTIYKQAFTDLWQIFFLLTSILLLLKKRFTTQPFLWICIGLIAALSYYGKAYSFTFFPLMILVTAAVRLKSENSFSILRLLVITGVVTVAMSACAFPWVYILHEKYGIWTTSTAGSLNMSWYLVGHPEHISSIKVLLPPPNSTSVFSFEDPYLIQGNYAKFWQSPKLMGRLLLRVAFNTIDWVQSSNNISPFYFFVWIISLAGVFIKKNRFYGLPLPLKIILIIFLIYPCAFWLLSFDNSRHLWFTIPLSMILGITFIEKFLFSYFPKGLRKVITAIFFLSYLPWIVTDGRSMLNTGKEEYAVAEQIKAAGINGSFTTNKAIEGYIGQYILRVAYFSQCPIYCYGENKWSIKEILNDALRYNVDYYFYFYDSPDSDFQLKGLTGEMLPEVTGNTIKGLKIFKLNNGETGKIPPKG